MIDYYQWSKSRYTHPPARFSMQNACKHAVESKLTCKKNKLNPDEMTYLSVKSPF